VVAEPDEKLAVMRRLADIQSQMSELRGWMSEQSAEAALHNRYAPRDIWLSTQKRLRELGREHQALQIKMAELNRRHVVVERDLADEKRKLFFDVVRAYVGNETYESLWAEVERRLNPTKPSLSALPPQSSAPRMRERE
jgi:hypothetical protein